MRVWMRRVLSHKGHHEWSRWFLVDRATNEGIVTWGIYRQGKATTNSTEEDVRSTLTRMASVAPPPPEGFGEGWEVVSEADPKEELKKRLSTLESLVCRVVETQAVR